MGRIEVKREKNTIRLYIVAILLIVVAIVIEAIMGAAEIMLYFSGGFGVLSALFLILGIDRARKRTVTHVYSQTGGFMGTTTARTLGILGAMILLLPLIAFAATSASYSGGITPAELVPGLVLLASGIIALIGAFTYKIEP